MNLTLSKCAQKSASPAWRGRALGGVVLVVMLTVALASPVSGALYEVYKDPALFGNLNQNNIPGPIGAWACGPAAAVNSFVYLENAYPTIYDRSLVPDTIANGLYDQAELIAVAQTLIGAGFMNTVVGVGTWHDNFIWGKMTYIEQQVPGMTIYEAQDPWRWGNPPAPAVPPAWVQPIVPTWDFLYGELVACEDVEILLNWTGGGHFLTLTSFTWDDVANRGTIDYIDPWTGLWGISNIWLGTSGIETDYVDGSWISMAVSESPIPEPAAIVIWGLLFGLACTSRRLRLL